MCVCLRLSLLFLGEPQIPGLAFATPFLAFVYRCGNLIFRSNNSWYRIPRWKRLITYSSQLCILLKMPTYTVDDHKLQRRATSEIIRNPTLFLGRAMSELNGIRMSMLSFECRISIHSSCSEPRVLSIRAGSRQPYRGRHVSLEIIWNPIFYWGYFGG